MNTKYLTVRAGSTHHEFGGTIHFVTGGFYHGRYNQNFYNNYDVAVLRVCTDMDSGIDISKYVRCLQ